MELITTGTAGRAQVGGKGAQLIALRELGLPVPQFFVLPVGAELDEVQLHAARAALGDDPVAVRSSAAQEDAATTSFAGQFDTVLNVITPEQLVEAVHTCRLSTQSDRVRTYCQQHGIDVGEIEMAVVVQRMFPSHISGVMFSADPAAPTANQVLISAGWGLGEGVVSGHADTDTYRVGDTHVEADVADKQRMCARKAGGGSEMTDVPEADRKKRCLTDEQARALAAIGRQLEAHFGRPQDIEWAVDQAGTIALLQTRPLTGIGPREGVVYTWDNSNIIESYSGVTTPLTFSFASAAYESVYRQFCQVMGVDDELISATDPTFKAMIGLVRGRIYYRLDSWYKVVTLLPGARYNKRFMEQMMGVKKQADLEEQPEGGGAGKLRIYYLAWRVAKALFTLGRRTDRFKAIFKEAYSAYHTADLDQMSANDLVVAYRELERRLLLNWKAPIINDFYAMIFFGVLKGMADGRHNDLLCGEPGMESTLPTREVMQMAATVRSTPTLGALFEQHDNAGVLARLSEHPLLDRWLASYLDRFGDRCMEELKLETSSLRDDPSFVIATLRNFVAREDLTIAAMEEREHRVRSTAEAEISVPWHKRILFDWILRRSRRHVRERENLRFARTRIFGLVRRIFRALGGHFVRAGLMNDAEDVFYLTTTEAFGLVEGTGASIDARGLVRLRRAEFDRYRSLPAPDDRFETRGGVHLGNVFMSNDPVEIPEGDVLTGLGCAPGVVRQVARVIHSPKDNIQLNGQIMVCERTDPGWVPLFPTCGGLLVERGSALSHSAIVAREFGIPTVVGIPGLLKRVEDGQWVELDGRAGVVRLDVGPPDTAEPSSADGQ